MSVNYIVGLGYGVIVDAQKKRQMVDALPDDDIIDTFYENYCFPLNVFNENSDYFIGVFHRLGTNCFCVPLDPRKKEFTGLEMGAFWRFMNEQKIARFIKNNEMDEYALTLID